MSSKSLSKEDIKKLLTQTDKPTPWPSEADLKLLAKAVREEAETVVFGDGMEFSISYAKISEWGAVFIRPADKSRYVPCGYFNVDRLKQGT